MKMSKKKITEKILDYVFKKYSDDEEIAIYMKDYYIAEKLIMEKNKNKPKKENIKYIKITENVRDFLEPLVDAEFFKAFNYGYEVDGVLIEAMEQLKTKLSECFNETGNNNTK